MLQLVPHFAGVWKEQREKAEEVGEAIIKSLHEMQEGHAGGDLNASYLTRCYESSTGLSTGNTVDSAVNPSFLPATP